MKPEINNVGGNRPEETAAPAWEDAQGRIVETASPGLGWWSGRFRAASAWRLGRHLLEMIAAMMVGMMLLVAGILAFGEPPGYSNVFVEYGLMGASMSGAMVAWMRFRGHAWWEGLEMTTAMLVPMFAVVFPFGWDTAGGTSGQSDHALMMLAHVAMIGGMVALMLYRWDRYTHG